MRFTAFMQLENCTPGKGPTNHLVSACSWSISNLKAHTARILSPYLRRIASAPGVRAALHTSTTAYKPTEAIVSYSASTMHTMRPTLDVQRRGAEGLHIARRQPVTATRAAPYPAHRRPRPARAAPAPGGAPSGTPPPAPAARPEAAAGPAAAVGEAPALAARRCEPCEAAKEAEAAMGLASAFDAAAAARYLAHLHLGWRVVEDGAGRLRVRRRVRTKNFLKVRGRGDARARACVRACSCVFRHDRTWLVSMRGDAAWSL